MVSACAGCGSTTTPPSTGTPVATVTGTPATGNRPASSATVTIKSPTEGQQVTGSMVHVEVAVDGATVVQATSTNIRPDQGHVHLFIDGNLQYMQYTLVQDFGPLKPGTYQMKAEFVAADHFPFNPRVYSKTIVFTVT
jgi:hypothetical protein